MSLNRTRKDLQQRIRFRETRLRFLHQAPPSVVEFETQVIKDLKSQLQIQCRQIDQATCMVPALLGPN